MENATSTVATEFSTCSSIPGSYSILTMSVFCSVWRQVVQNATSDVTTGDDATTSHRIFAKISQRFFEAFPDVAPVADFVNRNISHKILNRRRRMRSFGIIPIRVSDLSDPRSLGSWCIKEPLNPCPEWIQRFI